MTKPKVILICAAAAIAVAAGYYLAVSGGEVSQMIDIRVGDCILKVEIADTPHLRERGLSGRKTLETGHGMLFVFDYPQRLSFWMKDTGIPLSIAYISSEGIILQIEQMTPFDLRPVSSRSIAKYALEVNQGVFQQNGIAVGTRVDLTNVIEK